MPLAWSFLASNIKRLEAKFIHGYQIEANVFFVFLTMKNGRKSQSLMKRKRNGGHFGMMKTTSLNCF